MSTAVIGEGSKDESQRTTRVICPKSRSRATLRGRQRWASGAAARSPSFLPLPPALVQASTAVNHDRKQRALRPTRTPPTRRGHLFQRHLPGSVFSPPYAPLQPADAPSSATHLSHTERPPGTDQHHLDQPTLFQLLLPRSLLRLNFYRSCWPFTPVIRQVSASPFTTSALNLWQSPTRTGRRGESLGEECGRLSSEEGGRSLESS